MLLRSMTGNSCSSGRPRPQRVAGLDQSGPMLARVPTLEMGWKTCRGRRQGASLRRSQLRRRHRHLPVARARRGGARGAVSEARRVLRADGRLATVTPTWPRVALASRLYGPVVGVAARSDGWLAAMRPLDPRPILAAAGFQITASRYVGRGYQSLCVVAVVPE